MKKLTGWSTSREFLKLPIHSEDAEVPTAWVGGLDTNGFFGIERPTSATLDEIVRFFDSN